MHGMGVGNEVESAGGKDFWRAGALRAEMVQVEGWAVPLTEKCETQRDAEARPKERQLSTSRRTVKSLEERQHAGLGKGREQSGGPAAGSEDYVERGAKGHG